MQYALYIEHLPSKKDTFQGFYQSAESARRWTLHPNRKLSGPQYRYRLDTEEGSRYLNLSGDRWER